MKLRKLKIERFRRIYEADIYFGDATFLIGENNVGKSAILRALEIFFTETEKLDQHDFFQDPLADEEADTVVLTAELIDLPAAAHEWKGFKGRIISRTYDGEESLTITYRKTYRKGEAKAKREILYYTETLKQQYTTCTTITQLIEAGAPEADLEDVFSGGFDKSKTLTAADKKKFIQITSLWDYSDEEKWFENPGGFEGVMSVKLPKFLLIPAENKIDEINSTNGTLQKTMKELFEEVRESSENYRRAQEYLALLEEELDPTDEEKEFGKMMSDINGIVSNVFLDSMLHIETKLGEATAIKPTFDIEMSSNIRTKPERQGMGVIRSAVFALLRYRESFLERRRQEGEFTRTLIIGFEEPELYLHPNAANLMRNTIYELATSSNSKIVCTTHSPHMIDLTKKIDEQNYPKQILNSIKVGTLVTAPIEGSDSKVISSTTVIPFNTTEAYRKLENDDKDYVKFILKVDDYVARVFFARNIIIVEGDTEDILLKETIKRLPVNVKSKVQSDYQIIKARGKAAIIPLIKYFKAMDIHPFVIHDHDTEPGALKFNQPILNALGLDEDKRLLVMNCIEDLLGYTEPSNNKPYKAYQYIKDNWQDEWVSVQENWRSIVEERILKDAFSDLRISEEIVVDDSDSISENI